MLKSSLKNEQKVDSFYAMGLESEKRFDILRAIDAFEEASRLGHTEAQWRLGRIYRIMTHFKTYGNCQSPWKKPYFEMTVETEGEKALLTGDCWLNAAKAGHVMAQIGLGVLYNEGWGVEKNPKEELRWFAKAFTQFITRDNPQYQYFLGKMYGLGMGTPKNKEVSEHWINLASSKGYPPYYKTIDDAFQSMDYWWEGYLFATARQYSHSKTPALEKNYSKTKIKILKKRINKAKHHFSWVSLSLLKNMLKKNQWWIEILIGVAGLLLLF